ncbi:PAS domain-containing sensor histidine kinase [Ramlibacter sp. AN1015]|uniref:PAS domain-containing sensor histidine kinase n=1 Tax=Ramlibacter sp. AN1015 TaxID=3133428 RepID=UPI0030C371D2
MSKTSPAFKAAVALAAICDPHSDVAHRYGVSEAQVGEWHAQLVACAHSAFKSEPATPSRDLDPSELAQTIAENSTHALVLMDARGYCIYANQALLAMTGYTNEELGSKPLHDLIHHRRPDGSHYPMSECPIDRALPENFDVRAHEDLFFRKDGSSFPVRCAASPIFRGGKPVATVIEVQDITEERRRREHELAEIRRKDEFLAMLAHELRNPLAPITSAAFLLQRTCAEPAARRAGGIVAKHASHMASLVNDLLDVSRMTRGVLEIKAARVDLASTLRDAAEQVHPHLEARQQQLDITGPSEGVHVDGDHARLVQVFANLLDNASKYSPTGGRITVSVGCEAGSARVSVTDQGVGMSQQLVVRVFDLFTQGQAEGAGAGLGVGLALVKHIVELHRGSIRGSSDGEGRGSTFEVVLPAARA